MRALPTTVKTLLVTLVVWAAGIAPASAVLLYSQTSNPGANATVSQNFEAVNDAFDSRAADDFIVPVGGWTISSLFIDGMYFNGPGPATSVNVTFYADNGIKPGAILANRPSQPIASDAAGDFMIDLLSPVALGAGSYWLSVQANMNFTPGGQWGWTDRTLQSGDPAAWINAGAGFGTACTADWGSRGATCGIDSGVPDQVFSLSGTAGTSAVPEPGSLALLAIALAAFGLTVRRKSA